MVNARTLFIKFLKRNGIKMIYDKNCPKGTYYFVNTKYCDLRGKKGRKDVPGK